MGFYKKKALTKIPPIFFCDPSSEASSFPMKIGRYKKDLTSCQVLRFFSSSLKELGSLLIRIEHNRAIKAPVIRLKGPRKMT